MPAGWDLRPPTHPQGRMGPLAPAPAAARATAAPGGDSCAGKCKPAPSRQPLLPYAPASPSAHSIPHAGEGANTLAACWALGNNSANILACLLNTRPFASFFFPPSAPSSSVSTEPALGCASTPHTSTWRPPELSLCQRYFRVTRARSPQGNPCKAQRHQMAAAVPSDLQAFHNHHHLLCAQPAVPSSDPFAFSRDPAGRCPHVRQKTPTILIFHVR